MERGDEVAQSVTLAEGDARTSGRSLILFGAWVCFVVNLVRGMRVPGRWAATHLQFDYSQGFLKRSLAGAVLKAVGVPIEQFAAVAVFSAITSLLLIGVMIGFVRVTRASRGLTGAVAVLMMASSYAVVYMAHLIGYFDHLLWIIGAPAIVGVVWAKGRAQAWGAMLAAALASTAGLLIHEIYLLTLGPIVCLALWLREQRVAAVAMGAAMIAATVGLMEWGSGDVKTYRELVLHHRGLVDFKLRQDAFAVFSRDSGSNLDKTLARFSRPGSMRRFFGSLAIFGPVAIGFTWMSARRVWAGWRDRAAWDRICVTGLLVIASLAPQVLHLFGWDHQRWDALTVVSSFAVWGVCVALTPARRLGASERVWLPRFAVVILALNLTAGFGLMDRYEATPAPFFEHVITIQELVEGEDSLWVPPH